MMSGETIFQDRRDAGRRLAQALMSYTEAPDTCVLGLPRGGVIVGEEVSRVLHLPLEVLITRKLGTPGNPELAMGALAETGYRHLNPQVLQQFAVSERQLEEEVRCQQTEIARQVELYRQGRALPPLSGRTVLLVDDGLATGATFYASLSALRALEVDSLVAAVPVAPLHAERNLLTKADVAVILEMPRQFFAIGQFYADFSQVQDEEVIACLARGRASSREP